MKKRNFACAALPVAGMTLAMFAVTAVQMGTTLVHAGTLAHTLQLAAMFTLVYAGLIAGFAWLESRRRARFCL